MALPGVVIFVSTASRECGVSLKYIKENSIKAQVVRLDTREARDRAANGKYFQVKMVPTMIVNYEDGNMEIFIGNNKIIPVLNAIFRPPSRDGSGGFGMSPLTRGGGSNMYSQMDEIVPTKPVYAARPTISRAGLGGPGGPVVAEVIDDFEGAPLGDYPSRGEPKGDHRGEDDFSDEEREDDRPTFRRGPQPRSEKRTPNRFQEVEEEDDEIPPAPKMRKRNTAIDGDSTPKRTGKSKSKSKAKKSKGTKKKPPVIFEEDAHAEIEVEYLEDPSHPEEDFSNTSSKGGASSKKMKNSRMQGLIDVAKNMEQERLASLGYNEADLPHYH